MTDGVDRRANQVQALSQLVRNKYGRIRWAIGCLVAGLFLLVAARILTSV